jgi:hypothetical protein
MGGYDIDLELFEPLLKLLEQCKGAKTLSKSAFFTLTTFCISDSVAQETYETTRRPDSGFNSFESSSHPSDESTQRSRCRSCELWLFGMSPFCVEVPSTVSDANHLVGSRPHAASR